MDQTLIKQHNDLAKKNLPIEERLENLSYEEREYLSSLAILNEAIGEEDVLSFLEICGFSVSEVQQSDFLEKGFTQYVITASMSDGESASLFIVEQKTRKFIIQGLTELDIEKKHSFADQFYRKIFVDLLGEITDNEGVSDKDLTNMVLQPGGFIDFGAHHTQMPGFHNWSISRAFYWQEHLFALKKYDEAAHITNSICFALARNGHARIAKEMLARNAMVTNGLQKAVALVNLTTILREEQDHQQALKLYWRSLWPLVKLKATLQLAGVFSEMSNIYRDRGQLARALVFQELSSLLRLYLKDSKGRAICNNQLSILYRSMRFYRLALKSSKSAEKYWRSTHDEVNLAKALVTQGNLYNTMGKPDEALTCFDESLSINTHLGILSEAASSTSGKARAYLQLGKFIEAKAMLEEAIALRQRSSDHRIGIEYDNMGIVYQELGNPVLALRWYEKALPYFEKYQPGFVPQCQQKIIALQKQLS